MYCRNLIIRLTKLKNDFNVALSKHILQPGTLANHSLVEPNVCLYRRTVQEVNDDKYTVKYQTTPGHKFDNPPEIRDDHPRTPYRVRRYPSNEDTLLRTAIKFFIGFVTGHIVTDLYLNSLMEEEIEKETEVEEKFAIDKDLKTGQIHK